VAMKRQVFLIPGFFGFANLGDFAYWGPVRHKLRELLDDAGLEAEIHCVKSLPTASLRARTRCLAEAIAQAKPRANTAIHLVGHSTGGLDARLLLTPGVDLQTRIDVESIARRVHSSVSIATPHLGAPIASFFASMLGHNLLRLLSIVTIAALRGTQLPLTVWVEIAGLFALPSSFGEATGSLASQLYEQLLSDFNAERRAQVEELLGEVQRDQSLLTQLTVEAMDVFNAVAGDRDGVAYGSVVTRARPASLETSREIGFDFVDQAQQAFYYSLSKLAVGHELPPPNAQFEKQMRKHLGDLPDSDASDGIVPTRSQPWGHCIAAAQADHLDIIGHHGGTEDDPARHFDWLATRSHFRAPEFAAVWGKVAAFIARSEGGALPSS
jgi:triacylglycerol lipase